MRSVARTFARRTFVAVFAIGVVGAIESRSAGAQAERQPVRLSYTRETGAEACPDELVFRDSVLSRLGYDPFEDSAPRTLKIVVRRSGNALLARVELYDASGHLLGERDLNGSGTGCSELGTAVAIAASLGIDPLSAVAPPPTVAQSEAAPPPPQAVPPQPQAPVGAVVVRESSTSPRVGGASTYLRLGVGAVLTWGVSPSAPAAGPMVDVGLRRGPLSLTLEGAAGWAPTAAEQGYGVKSSIELISLAPCVHFWVGLGCVIGGVGSLNATGVVKSPLSDHAVFGDLGARIGVEVPFATRFFVQFHIDGLANLTHVAYDFGKLAAWNTLPLSESLGLAVGVVP
jgi:hypothetical protein